MSITITILLVLTIIGWIGSVLWERIRKNATRTSSKQANRQTHQRAQIEEIMEKQRAEYEAAFRQYGNQQPARPDYAAYNEDSDDMPSQTTSAHEWVEHENKITSTGNTARSNLLNVNKPTTNRKQDTKTAHSNNIAEELNLSDVDNARKAFIASELFDRKY